jgi:hypothetical protein
MCPACLVSAGVVLSGAVGGGGLSVAVIEGIRKCFRREAKRDSSTAQADNPAGAGLKRKNVGLLRSE